MDINSGENEWLSEPPTDNDPEVHEQWAQAWEELKKDCSHLIQFTDDIYCSSEFDGPPEWIDVHIRDEFILEFKMARGIISSMQGADSIVFRNGFDCDVEKSWGGIGFERMAISASQVFVTITAKHSSEELEVNITEQFNQAIGEE
jgi:hypothetical protein